MARSAGCFPLEPLSDARERCRPFLLLRKSTGPGRAAFSGVLPRIEQGRGPRRLVERGTRPEHRAFKPRPAVLGLAPAPFVWLLLAPQPRTSSCTNRSTWPASAAQGEVQRERQRQLNPIRCLQKTRSRNGISKAQAPCQMRSTAESPLRFVDETRGCSLNSFDREISVADRSANSIAPALAPRSRSARPVRMVSR